MNTFSTPSYLQSITWPSSTPSTRLAASPFSTIQSTSSDAEEEEGTIIHHHQGTAKGHTEGVNQHLYSYTDRDFTTLPYTEYYVSVG